jgi:hypothetical protein
VSSQTRRQPDHGGHGELTEITNLFPACPGGFQTFLAHLETRVQEYRKPVMLAHGDEHFFFMDQPFPNVQFSRVQTYGESLVHWVKVRVDPKSSGVFSIERKIVTPNL